MTPSPAHPDDPGAALPGRGTGRPSSRIGRFLARLVRWTLAIAALGAVFWIGFRVGVKQAGRAGDAAAMAGPAAAQVWTCSMHPEIRRNAPGLCPICGMELIPVAPQADIGTPSQPLKYACAMMCVPPLDRPGLCPVCGMQMVPVEEHAGPAGAGSHAAADRSVALSPAAVKLARVETATVERRFVAAEIRMVGKVDYDETRLRSISSRVPGRLDKLYVDYTGVPVNMGEHLVSLYSPELLAAQQELIQALKAAPQQEPGMPEDLRRIRAEALDAARQKLQLWGLTEEQIQEIERRGTPSDHLTIYAPIGGIVIDKQLVEGAYVEEGTPIYTIADLSRLWVKLDAYELDLAWIRYGQHLEFTTEAYPGEIFQGTISFIDPVLNDRTRTAKVRVNVPNPDGRLKPGMFVRAVVRSQITLGAKVMDPTLAGQWICPMHPEVVADGPQACPECGMPLVPAESLGYASASIAEAQPPLVVPMTAPLITGLRAIVYVAVPGQPGRYEGREVLLGPRAGDYYLVREGLAEGEQVVVRGNLYVDSAVQILARRSMMSPSAGTPAEEPESGEQPAGAAPRGGASASESAGGAAAPGAPPAPLPAGARQALDRIYEAYLAMHRALSGDAMQDAVNAAPALAAAVGELDAAELPAPARQEWNLLLPGLRKSVDGVARAADIASARAAFEGISNALITVARHVGLGSRPRLLVYHCPMAFDNRGARWLQAAPGVENPYFGSAMFTCGVVSEVLPASGAGGAP